MTIDPDNQHGEVASSAHIASTSASEVKQKSSLKKRERSIKYRIRSPEEIEAYDFVKERNTTTKTINVFESIAHMVKGVLGAGAVSIHESYIDCGVWSALVINLVLGISVGWFMYVLVCSAQKMYSRVGVSQMTYPDLAEASLIVGPWPALRNYSRCFRIDLGIPRTLDLFKTDIQSFFSQPVYEPQLSQGPPTANSKRTLFTHLIESVLVVEMFGSCCVCQIVVARALKQLVDASDQVLGTLEDPCIRVYVGSLLLPCVVLSMITNLKFMAPLSLVANIYMVLLAIVTIKYGYAAATHSILEFPVFESIPGLFEFIGVAALSMEGIGTVMPIENHMTEPRKFHLVILGAIPAVMSLVMIIGFFGCWGYGDDATSPITINFAWVPFAIVMKVYMIFATYVTFTMNFWVGFEVIWYHLKLIHAPGRYWVWERVYRTILVTLITAVACAFPDVTKFIALLGCLCSSIGGFICPAFIELSLAWEEPGLGYLWWRLWRFILILIAGLVIFLYGTFRTAKNLVLNVF